MTRINPKASDASPGETTVRLARKDDVAELSLLYSEAVSLAEVFRGGSQLVVEHGLQPPVEEAIERCITARSSRVFVAQFEDVIAGFVIAHRELRGGAEGESSATVRIETFFVLPGLREIGIGEAILDQVLKWARSTGSAGLDALALPGDQSTKAFFESMGFRARLLVMARDLSSRDESDA